MIDYNLRETEMSAVPRFVEWFVWCLASMVFCVLARIRLSPSFWASVLRSGIGFGFLRREEEEGSDDR
jgi:hypothetical protein